MARRTTRMPRDGERWCPKCNGYKDVSEFGNMPSYVDGIDPYCKEHRKEARDASRAKSRRRAEFDHDVSSMSDMEFGKFVVWLLEEAGEEEAARRLRGGDYFAPD